MKKRWKKPAVKITAAVLVIALALLGLWISSLRPPPAISFDFLNGRDITASVEDVPSSSHRRVIRYSYTLAADFTDVCLSADAELLALGYEPPSFVGPTQRLYRKRVTFRDSGYVFIQNKRLTTYSKPNAPDYSSFYSDEHDNREGRVIVDILHSRLRLWPPQHLLYGLKMRLQAAKIPPPPRSRPVPVRQTPQSDYFSSP